MPEVTTIATKPQERLKEAIEEQLESQGGYRGASRVDTKSLNETADIKAGSPAKGRAIIDGTRGWTCGCLSVVKGQRILRRYREEVGQLQMPRFGGGSYQRQWAVETKLLTFNPGVNIMVDT